MIHLVFDIQGLWILVAHGLSWLVAIHALLRKRDPRSALGWTVAILFLPVVGVFLYLIFGIGRAESRAARLLRRSEILFPAASLPVPASDASHLPENRLIARLGDRLSSLSLCSGNALTPFYQGDTVYPAMIRAINQARSHVYLSTYIFRYGRVGCAFCRALARAARRGVDVRLLIDGFGSSAYTWRKPWKDLDSSGVRIAFFLPLRLFPPNISINLRNHRKILVCDAIGFTGGMNIADNHLSRGFKDDVQDVHFRCDGPVVEQLRYAFLLDWNFATRERDFPLFPPAPTAELPDAHANCRVVLDGPGSHADTINDLISGVINCARHSVRIMTPYFLPTHEIVASLRSAAQRGVDVRIVLPAKNNLPYVHWATFRLLPALLDAGVRIWYQLPPFAHSKLLTIDSSYAQIGTANLDARSLRLNFELNMEVFDRSFSEQISTHIDRALQTGREITLQELMDRPLICKVRDAAFWIFSPYL